MKNSPFFKLKCSAAVFYNASVTRRKRHERRIFNQRRSTHDRSYHTYDQDILNHGILSGTKVDGAWSFTPEQIEAFTQNPAVQPSIRAKKNAIVFDFLGTKPRGGDRMCTVLDLELSEAMKASVFFCEKVSSITPDSEIHSAAEPIGAGVRIILSGSPKDVLGMLNQYYSK